MHALDQRLATYSSPMARLMGRLFAGAAPTNAAEALQDAEELVKMLKEQGLEGMELSKAYGQHLPNLLRGLLQPILTCINIEIAQSTASKTVPLSWLRIMP